MGGLGERRSVRKPSSDKPERPRPRRVGEEGERLYRREGQCPRIGPPRCSVAASVPLKMPFAWAKSLGSTSSGTVAWEAE